MAKARARGPVPAASIRAWYQDRLLKLGDEMKRSVLWWLGAVWKRRQSEIALDASPARDLDAELRRLVRQWVDRYEEAGEEIARALAKRVNTNASRQIFSSLKDAGLTVAFSNSRRVNSVLQSIIAENVGLIRSIPGDLLGNVRSIVFGGLQNGRDMAFIADSIEAEFKKGRNHAVRIAVDQTNKATEALALARASDMGVTHGFWIHRSGSKKPRETHVEFDGQRYELAKGLYDSDVGEWVKPAELIWCRCTVDWDLDTIGGAGAQDASLDAAGRRRMRLPAATVTWSD